MFDFIASLRGLRPEIEAALEELLPSSEDSPAWLHQAMRYATLGVGKRVRPGLVILVGEALGATRQDLLGPAAAVELVHCFSLIHDDLPALDDDDLRRGRPTVHRRFDEATAILAGDALLTLGLDVLTRMPASQSTEVRLRAVSLLAGAVGSTGMIGGQMADLEAERGWPDDPAVALDEIHRRKTGALFVACVQMGGLYAGVAGEEDRLLAALGEKVGMMFQIADDILDVEGASATLGKTAGKDAKASKLTYPGLYGVEASRRRLEEAAEEARELVSRLPALSDLFTSLVSFLVHRNR